MRRHGLAVHIIDAKASSDCFVYATFSLRRAGCYQPDRTGPENVRARLAQTNAGSAGSIAIGTEINMTIGFAQEWLAWHDKQKAEREAQFRRRQIYWTRWAAWAASVAALAAVFGWLLKIF
jgi:hypothetical protein